MSANVETMYSAGRQVPWHGLGKVIDEAPTSADAIKLAGLDWTVETKPVFTDSGIAIPGYYANMRSSDNSVLGIVGDRYQVVQNSEAFSFTDSLIEEGDVRYETAGSLRDGKTVWMLAKMPEQKILDDKFDPYICFTNSHDGTGAIKICMTPIRVVCNNTLNLALRNAKRTWSAKHTGSISTKLDEAKETLGLANKYMEELNNTAEELAYENIDEEYLNKFLSELFPVSASDSELKKSRAEDAKANFMVAYYMPDISQYRGTKYGLVNAITDMVDHAAPVRNTKDYQSNNWSRILNGHKVVDAAYSILVR